MEPAELAQARLRIERSYLQDMREVRHKRKNSAQIKCLNEHFKFNPVWNYQKKLHIAEQLGMTLSQVSKWNWDERKK